ncbi:hypothetical protein TVAG_468260 [Trichomonas vaginalis G3]|uniref:Raptor N-terminal CASPase-like domain-containing protein n=1 Tax=Trichomonas vaginalis (strain ATCC PRA-98 / G3) TaxID=412133 RepID=A2E0R5_TRIV3|nr:TOR signaling [Trichomonas vaginalis G3]EAY13810.1 hypothetical protein TVAG_468260 [Trichomonas vaginalis G3]KAI5542676.1 TOR signaling [Trichomonas vaginalis G3]|eukprot:XP_001326033.1 hypothetical protein [Trichomonas vaginalis G3]
MTSKEDDNIQSKQPLRSTAVTIYKDWVHSSVTVFGMVPKFEPFEANIITQTSTGFLFGCIPSNRTQSPQANQSSPTHFWHDISDFSIDLDKVIRSQFEKAFGKVQMILQLNQPVSELMKYLEMAKQKKSKSPKQERLLFEYYSYGTPQIENGDLHFCSNKGYEKVNIKEILNLAGKTSCFIFDCDNSGSLLPYIKEQDSDIYAFFSDSDGEFIPRSNGLPADLFTSCLMTPAQMALLWHSRHYFCFKNGPLTPLNTSFEVECMCDFKKIYENINTLLRHIVEAMAYKTMGHEKFMKIFRKDRVVSQIAINFVLAQRIFSFFEKKPISYPEIPDMTKNSLWNSFDMRMDAELFRVQRVPESLQIPFSVYLNHVLTTLDNAVVVSKPEITYFPELSFISSMLNEESLQARACTTLAKYLDKSPDCIRISLHFSVVPKLIQILNQGKVLACIFCIIKLFNYERSMWKHFENEKSNSPNLPLVPIVEWIKKTNPPTLPLILLTLLTKDSVTGGKKFVEMPWKEIIMPLFKHKHSDVRVWAMFLTANICKYLDDSQIDEIFEASKLNMDDDCELELKLASIHLCSEMSNGETSEIQLKILKYICQFISSSFYIIRCQVLSAISVFYSKIHKFGEENQNEVPNDENLLAFDELASQQLILLAIDQHPSVMSATKAVYNDIANKNDPKKPSKVFECFRYKLFDKIYRIIDSTDVKISTCNNDVIVKHVINDLKPVKEFKDFTLGPTFTHNQEITTNICINEFNNLVYFGDLNGELHIKPFKENRIVKTAKISPVQLDHVEVIQNNGFPVLFTSNSNGFIQSYLVRDTDLTLTSISDSDVTPGLKCRKIFNANDISGFMLSYSENASDKIQVYDLEQERVIRTISADGFVKHAAWCDTGSNLIGICCNNEEYFKIYDIRENKQIYNIKIPEFAYQYLTADYPNMKYSVASNFGKIYSVDLLGRDQVDSQFLVSGGQTTCSFSMQPCTRRYLLGHEKGVTLFDTQNKVNKTLTKFWNLIGSGTTIGPVTSSIYHPVENSMNMMSQRNIVVIYGNNKE